MKCLGVGKPITISEGGGDVTIGDRAVEEGIYREHEGLRSGEAGTSWSEPAPCPDQRNVCHRTFARDAAEISTEDWTRGLALPFDVRLAPIEPFRVTVCDCG